jgi:hypothetical protein
MRQFMMTATALAAFGAMVATAQAEKHTRSPSHPVKQRASCERQLHQPHLSCAPLSPMLPATRQALARLGWRSASPNPTCRLSSLTSCR